jgi:hypothetical protein
MDKPIGLIATLLVGAIIGAAPSALGAQGAAIVTDLEGQVLLANAAPVELLRELEADTPIELRPGARLVLLHFGTQQTYELRGPDVYVLGRAGVQNRAGARAVPGKALPPAFRDVRLRPATITQASIPMRGSSRVEGALRLVSPVATWLLERPTQLRWEAAGADVEYRVQLTDSENRPVFETATRATSVRLPDDLSIEPGKLYGWHLQARAAEAAPLEAWTEFGLAGEALAARAAAARPAAVAAESDHIAYALLLEALNLREAARAQWAQAAQRRPEADRLRALAEMR